MPGISLALQPERAPTQRKRGLLLGVAAVLLIACAALVISSGPSHSASTLYSRTGLSGLANYLIFGDKAPPSTAKHAVLTAAPKHVVLAAASNPNFPSLPVLHPSRTKLHHHPTSSSSASASLHMSPIAKSAVPSKHPYRLFIERCTYCKVSKILADSVGTFAHSGGELFIDNCAHCDITKINEAAASMAADTKPKRQLAKMRLSFKNQAKAAQASTGAAHSNHQTAENPTRLTKAAFAKAPAMTQAVAAARSISKAKDFRASTEATAAAKAAEAARVAQLQRESHDFFHAEAAEAAKAAKATKVAKAAEAAEAAKAAKAAEAAKAAKAAEAAEAAKAAKAAEAAKAAKAAEAARAAKAAKAAEAAKAAKAAEAAKAAKAAKAAEAAKASKAAKVAEVAKAAEAAEHMKQAIKHMHIATAAQDPAFNRFRDCILSGSAVCNGPTTSKAIHSLSHAMAETKNFAEAGMAPSVRAAPKLELAAAIPSTSPPSDSQSIKTVSSNADDGSVPANFFVF